MIIYGEYLFMENFMAGGLLLYMTAFLCRAKVERLRLIAGAAVCGAGGFLIFVPLHWAAGAAVRIGIGALAVGVFMGVKGIIKRTVVFICLTFLSGGGLMAFMLWRQQPAISGNGAFYLSPDTYLGLLLWGSIALFITFAFIKIIRKTRQTGPMTGRARVEIKGRQYDFEAVIDSGNSLREPLTGRPVMLLDRKGRQRIAPEIEERYVAIPFRAVGVEKGLLEGIRTDRIVFEEREFEGAVIAFHDGDFGEAEMLLNREVLDEEIL